MSLSLARLAADAVLYEGYLLYPYRATSGKNQVRWQFGVLGPPGAAAGGVGEEADYQVQCPVRTTSAAGSAPGATGQPRLEVYLRCLQLQRRTAQQLQPDGSHVPVAELRVGSDTWTSWDEAVQVERMLGPFDLGAGAVAFDVEVEGGEEIEALPGGQLVRRRWPLQARVEVLFEPAGDLRRLTVRVVNTADDWHEAGDGEVADKDQAIRRSLIGAHLLLVVTEGTFCSVIDPPDDAREAAADCTQRRCWPVLAGEEGAPSRESDVVLGSPIILYDHPAVAPESPGALFDSTEIDEILTLRVMTLTDDEKAAARATDPAAAAIIDRCDQMSPAQMQQLHGVLRDPHRDDADPGADPDRVFSTDVPWWDPETDASVDPDSDTVQIDGVSVARGSEVVVRPRRRADAHDMFFSGQRATVKAVHFDVDGETHIAVVLVDDPAAEMHDWYGRYYYFAPDELEPVREENDREGTGNGDAGGRSGAAGRRSGRRSAVHP